MPSETNSALKIVSEYSNNRELNKNNLNLDKTTNLEKDQLNQKKRNTLKQQITTTEFETTDDLAVMRDKNDFLLTTISSSIINNNKSEKLKTGKNK